MVDIIAPSETEIQNSVKIMSLLSRIDGISYEQQDQRPDIILIHEEDTNLDLYIDVEEDTVICLMEITKYQGSLPQGLADKLLEINDSAVHGAFTTNSGKLYFKSNLEIANVDLNEIEASIRSIFYVVSENISTIHEYFEKQ